MIPTKTKTTETPAKVAPVAAAMMQAITTITNIMLTHTTISHNDEDAAAIYTACTLMEQTMGLLKELVRDQLQPGTYGDAVLTFTTRQTRNLVDIPRIRELAAEVDDDDALPPQPQEEEARICRYIVDHMQKDSNESKSENFHCDVYEVTA